MNDTHDMTEHTTAVAPDAPSRAMVLPAEAAPTVPMTSAEYDTAIKPTQIRLMDPKVERTRDAWHDLKASANNLFLTARYHSIRALPSFLVNNSTNILGVTHVMTEMMMLKASGADTKLIQNPQNPINWVWEPIKNVFEGTFKAARIQHTDDKSLLPSTGNVVKDKYELIVKTDLATKRELDRLEKKQVKEYAGKHAAGVTKSPLEVDQIRSRYKHRLSIGKDEFADELTLELEKMNKNTRAAKVKALEGELQEISGGAAYSQMRLSNPWQMRSTLAGLVVWALSAVWPDKKESDDEVERMAVMRSTNLPRYVAERFKQAVWVPEWASHKRQMIGLGIMTSGICSLLGSWRNRKTLLTDAKAVVELAGLIEKKGLMEEGATGTLDKIATFTEKKKAARYEYEFNPSYFATSLLTFLSSFPLLFASDNEHGFSGFGTLMTGRLAFLPSSIGKKIRDKEPGVGFYSAGMASFQAENWAQALAGGAEVKKDPKTGEKIIVDHEDERKAAKIKSDAIRSKRQHGDETPTLKISHVMRDEVVQEREQQKA